MRMWWLAVLAIAVLCAVPGVALAQPGDTPPGPGRGPHPMMEKMKKADTNQDGKVTYEELKAVAPGITEARFKEMDTNGDGALTVADRPPRGQRGPGMGHGPGDGAGRFERLRAADKDGDKKVSRAEFKAEFVHAPAPVFDRMDSDGDGFLTAADAPKGKPEPAAKTKEPSEKQKAAKAARPGAEDAKKYRERLKTADKDSDGKITKEEFKAAFPNAPEERFSKMDRNGDGVLTKEDRKQAKQ